MIVPPAGSNVDRVKLKVTGTPVCEAMRFDEAMMKDNEATCPKIAPDATATEGAVSADVATETPTEPAVTLPMTKPDSVTTNDEAGTAAPVEVTITDVLVAALQASTAASGPRCCKSFGGKKACVECQSPFLQMLSLSLPPVSC